MTDEYWKKRAEKLPHYKPAHETQGKNLEDILNSIPGLPKAPQINNNDDGWGREIDLTKRLAGMIPNTVDQLKAYHATFNRPNIDNASETRSESSVMVYLREGQTGYKKLQLPAEAGSQVSLAINTGPLAGTAGREFRFIGTANFYIIDHTQYNHGAIDMTKLDYSKMKKLSMVEAPFIGTLLVPESAIIFPGNNTGRQILKG